MDPKSGIFHELDYGINDQKLKELTKALAEADDSRDGVYKRHFDRTDDPKARLHPDMADLVIKATRKPVPAHWPIFSIGEGFEIEGYYAEIRKIHSGDLEVCVEFLARDRLLIGDVVEIKGHKFKVRKSSRAAESKWSIFLRPVVGRPHNYLK